MLGTYLFGIWKARSCLWKRRKDACLPESSCMVGGWGWELEEDVIKLTLLDFPTPQLQPLLPPPSRLPPPLDKGDILGCLLMESRAQGVGPSYKPCSTVQWQLAGFCTPSYLTLTTWCCTDGGFQAPSCCERAGEGLRLEPWEHRAARSPSPGRELPPRYSCGAWA